MRRRIALTSALALVAASAALAAGPLKGRITADGSSTVGPWTTSAAELFRKKNPRVAVTVGISGTGAASSGSATARPISRTRPARSSPPSP